MSLMPAFEIGVWNAWILMVALILFYALTTLMQITGNLKKRFLESAAIQYSKTEKRADTLSNVILVLAIIYSVFLPLQLGTAWFYVGLAIFLLGIIIHVIVSVSWAITPFDEPVTKGIYRYSRHPLYLDMFLQLAGVGIASASWVFLLLAIVFIILMRILVIAEEHFCLEKYGDAYREYMNRTPRWIGIPSKERIYA